MRKKKILILGAADLSDGWMFINNNFPGEDLVVTEIRQENDLVAEYREDFIANRYGLSTHGVEVVFGVDAFNIPVKLLSEVSFIFWGCPFFESGEFNVKLQEFFSKIESYFESIKQPMPFVGVALDCLGPDGLYNLSTKYSAFNVQNWDVKFLLDIKEHYMFTPSHPTNLRQNELSAIISDNILMLVYGKNTNSLTRGSPDAIANEPFWVDFQDSEPMFYPNLFNMRVIKFEHFLKKFMTVRNENLVSEMKGNADNNFTSISKEQAKWMNCLSNPKYKHPVRPTRVLKETNVASWLDVWNLTKGGLFFNNASKVTVPPPKLEAKNSFDALPEIARINYFSS